MLNIMWVALGGSVGAVCRYLVSNWASARLGAYFPYGTLIVNVCGCFIIGAFMVLSTERLLINPYWRLLVTVGFVGGLTTFSSFSYETLKLVEDAEYALAVWNMTLNLTLGLLAAWLGMALARTV